MVYHTTNNYAMQQHSCFLRYIGTWSEVTSFSVAICMKKKRRFSADNINCSVKLANVSTTCRYSSHPQVKFYQTVMLSADQKSSFVSCTCSQ